MTKVSMINSSHLKKKIQKFCFLLKTPKLQKHKPSWSGKAGAGLWAGLARAQPPHLPPSHLSEEAETQREEVAHRGHTPVWAAEWWLELLFPGPRATPQQVR